jgi:hypothetical protein
MKLLAKSTIVKKLKILQFCLNVRTGHYVRVKGLSSQFLAVYLDSLNIQVTEARWTKRSNVHIISYWRWPSTLKELDKMIEDMKETYTELCGILWT